ncbi:MAG: tRNA (guanosine(37)-N1)-methyltransferase TrmD [Rickettsiales bacterium]|nr:tRNA (guanosine(37)-N1)-methyltransferase TrmD [Rickettsiales bacterium]
MFKSCVITLFPEMFPGPLGYSLIGTALKEQKWDLQTINIRDFGHGKHAQVDDTPYGGGAGMVLRADVIGPAIDKAFELLPDAKLAFMSPKGEHFTQKHAVSLIESPLIILCGRFEAVDERIIDKYQPIELSIGDFVMTGGELAAMAMLDACVRLLPGVVGEETSLHQESFGLDEKYACLLEHPHYTKPPNWQGLAVPDVLTSGNHAKIDAWRLERSEEITKQRRGDMWKQYLANKE